MGLTPIWLFLLATLLGVALVLVGRRGVRISRSPICRDCRAALPNAPAAADAPPAAAPLVCPACGSALSRRGAVLPGRRRRLWPVEILGWAVLLALAGAAAMIVHATLSGRDQLELLPTSVLARHVATGGPDVSDRAARILNARARLGRITPPHWSAVVDAALARQADADRPWTRDWADLLAHADSARELTPAQRDSATLHAIVLRVRARDGAAPAGPLPVTIEVDQARDALDDTVLAQVSIVNATLAGRPVRPIDPPPPRASSDDPIPPWRPVDERASELPDHLGALSSRASGWAGTGFDAVGLTLFTPADLPPGTHTLTLELNVSATPASRASSDERQPVERTLEFSIPVNIADRSAPPTPVAPTPEALAELHSSLRPESIDASSMAFTLLTQPHSVPISADVWLIAGEQRVYLGPFASTRILAPNQPWTTTRPYLHSMGPYVYGAAPGLSTDAPTADLLFIPTPTHAWRTLDQTKYLDAPLLIENIPIRPSRPAPTPNPEPSPPPDDPKP